MEISCALNAMEITQVYICQNPSKWIRHMGTLILNYLYNLYKNILMKLDLNRGERESA